MALIKQEISDEVKEQENCKRQYEAEKLQCNKSLEQAEKLKSQLIKINSELSTIIDSMSKNFYMGNKTGDNGKIELINQRTIKIIKKLNETIIPNIKSRINELSRNINSLQSQIDNQKYKMNELK